MDLKNRVTALVTGASGGIGYELAKLFARDQYTLILVARNGTRLDKVAAEFRDNFSAEVQCVAIDLSVASAPQLLFDRLRHDSIDVDVLVNNAGFGKYGDFADVPLEESLGQIQLNIEALTALTKLFLAQAGNRHRRILNIASTAGFQPGPHMSVYYATKAYVISFSEALAYELKQKGVTVTCLCPGVTETDFQNRAGTGTTIFKRIRPMDAASVARYGYRALMRGKTLAIPGLLNWLLAETVRLSPRKVVTAVSGRLLEP